MKHLLFLSLASLLFSQKLEAQDQRLFWKYKEYDGAIAFAVPGFLPKLASIFVKGKDERRLVRRTGKMRFMFFEEGCPISAKDWARFSKDRGENGLSDLISVREGDTRVRLMVKENGRRIRKLVVLVQDAEEFVLVSIKGRFKYSDINRLIKKYEKTASDKTGKKPLPLKIPVKVAREESTVEQ